MSGVVEHLAELTGLRDRDVLDTTLVGALRDLLSPELTAIYRCVGEIGQERWLTRARLARGDVAATADPVWSDLADLPALEQEPERLACLRGNLAQCSSPNKPGLVVSYFPLDADRDTMGVLELQTLKALDAESTRLVSSMLRVYRNFQALLDDSERDTLTGLLNRKTFDDSFWRAAKTTVFADVVGRDDRRAAGPATAWLAVIDIDHFKRVNDNFGHLIGDEVLLLLSRLMRSSFRFHDNLFRFGGEEFVVLMRCADQACAASAFERLRLNVQRYVFPQVGEITVSLGYTQIRSGDTPQGAFERADHAVYYAKQQGRNQVRHHEKLVAQGELEDASRSSEVELF